MRKLPFSAGIHACVYAAVLGLAGCGYNQFKDPNIDWGPLYPEGQSFEQVVEQNVVTHRTQRTLFIPMSRPVLECKP